MHRIIGNGHVTLTAGLSAPVKHGLGCPPPKRGLIKHYARHVTAGIFGGLFGGSKGSTKTCKKCQGKGAIPCPGCKGTGRNKKNGNMFERWKCYDCQGFGQITCPLCGGGEGLTPEQRRER